jgi:hypothetical protein
MIRNFIYDRICFVKKVADICGKSITIDVRLLDVSIYCLYGFERFILQTNHMGSGTADGTYMTVPCLDARHSYDLALTMVALDKSRRHDTNSSGMTGVCPGLAVIGLSQSSAARRRRSIVHPLPQV